MTDTPSTILKSVRHFFSGTVISRFTGLLRDIATAFAFGTDSAVAAFLVAFRFAHLLRRLFGEGALQIAFIPQFEQLKQKDPLRACGLFRDLKGLLSISLLSLIAVLMAALGLGIYFGNVSRNNEQILFLTFLMMPSLLFICLYELNSALLQCEKNNFISGIAPAAFNLVWIGGIYVLADKPAVDAMHWLALFIIAACIAQWIVTVPQTFRILNRYGLKNPFKGVQVFSKDLLVLAKPLMMGTIGVGAAQVNSALDAIFARYANLEGPMYLWYAIRIQQLPLALFGLALSGAILPPLARAIKCGDLVGFKQFLALAIGRGICVMLPITLALFVFGDLCVNILYGHGGFKAASVIPTTHCLWGYGFGLIPMTLVLILAPAFYAKDNYYLPMRASAMAMILNMGLNAIFILGLNLDTSAVAWATGISAWVNFLILACALRQSIGRYTMDGFWKQISKVGIASGAGCFVALSLKNLYANGWIASKLSGASTSLLHTFLMEGSQLLELVLVFCFVMVFIGWLLKVDVARNYNF
jgi:putative peptidoglycan lipid II flippase